jgi:hypothetical protein
MKRIQALVLIFSTILALTCVSGSFEMDHFRAIYDGPWNCSFLAEMGFDALYRPLRWRVTVDEILPMLTQEGLEAAANNLTYICGLMYCAMDPVFNYSRAVNAEGFIETRTPSPVDEFYWTKLVDEPGAAVANLSLHCPIAAIVWDIELYGRQQFDYCDYTFDEAAIRRFADETNTIIPELSRSKRHDWFSSNGRLEEFQRWQEETVYRQAKATEEMIHAINPNLSLGTLGPSHCWWYPCILKGFSTETQPVTAWTERTYDGYEAGEVEWNQVAFAELGVNGRVMPGLWPHKLDPFTFLMDMDFATRYQFTATYFDAETNASRAKYNAQFTSAPDGFQTTYNGSFWLYPGGLGSTRHPWLGSEEDYIMALRLLENEVYFNRAIPHPLPIFYIYPGIEVRAYLGPEGVTAFLNPEEKMISEEFLPPKIGLSFSDVELAPCVEELTYVDTSMNTKHVTGSVIPLDDLPCMVLGLGSGDLDATRIWARIHELEDLIATCDDLGLFQLPQTREAWELSLEDFRDGRYESAKESAINALEQGYELVMKGVWPFVEAGFADPRNSPVPMAILHRVNWANRLLEEGEEMEGRMYLLRAIKDWSEIAERPSMTLASICASFATVSVFRRSKLRNDS